MLASNSVVPNSRNTDHGNCNVNKKTFHVKLIYFLYLAGTSSLRPYFPIYFRHVGLDETQAGIITGIQPFVRFFSEPLWGGIADRLACHKAILLTVILLSTFFNTSLCSVSLIQNYVGSSQNESGISSNSAASFKATNDLMNALISCSKIMITCDDPFQNVSPKSNRFPGGIDDVATCCCKPKCLKSIPDRDGFIYLEFTDVEKTSSYLFSCEGTKNVLYGVTEKDRGEIKGTIPVTKNNQSLKFLKNWATAKECLCPFLICRHRLAEAHASNPGLTVSSGTKASSDRNVRHVNGPLSRTESFYVLLGLAILGQFFSGPILSIVDASTMKILGSENQGKFGNQRLWGAIGFGLAGFLSGFAMNETNTLLAGANRAEKSSYMAAFFMYFGLSAILIMVCCFFEVSREEKAHLLCRHLKVLLSRVAVITFLAVVLAMGISSGVINAFLFWYLEDLGASQLLVGLSITVTCISEVVVFSLAGKLIKYFGYAGVLYLSLIAFIARFVAYTFLTDPWYVLPIEILHGFTYAAMWSVCICYASMIAPSEIATTVQGVVSGVHFGLGWGIGGMAGGIVYQEYGAKTLFISCAVLCGVALLLFTIIQTTVKLQDVTESRNVVTISREPEESDPLLGRERNGSLSSS